MANLFWSDADDFQPVFEKKQIEQRKGAPK